METAVLAAIITGVATITSATSVLLVAYRDVIIDRLRFKPRNVSGLWVGKAKYTLPSDKIHEFTCTFKQRLTIIEGTLVSTGNGATEYKIEGRFFESEYLSLTVTNAVSETINYAIGIVHFERGGKKMVGYFVGRGRTTDGVVAGTLEFTRQ